ncbi:hypothetical protein HOW07_09725 [Plantibacter sp. MCCC 1A11337]|uniref:hypothetical protein n=1 Tax=Plantibacter sp. MCCC 1A11337 TaxID=2736644 RepID=UPI001582DA0A|nr:hypothetical protein [Plantibacter sp. MCCC 1A11337]NUJ88287.1 hypothetical protein [Plantibacter sp. MCCC 1A11337]
MPLNTSPVRRDIDYLRRRVKPRPAPVTRAEPVASAPTAPPPAAPAASAAPSTGLTLGGPSTSAAAPPASVASAASAPSTGLSLGGSSSTAPAAPSARPATTPAAAPTTPQPFPAPTAEEVRVLDDETPLVRLDPRQSAIGSLIVGGATAIVWETVELVTGVATADGVDGTPVTTPGNRPLLGFDGGDAILALRHVHLIRRALFVGTAGRPLTVQLFDGESFAAADETGAAPVVSLLRIGSRLELRLEPLPAEIPLQTLLQQFGFEPTPYVVAREPRRR